MKKLRKLLLSIMVVILTILGGGIANSVNAESAGPLYLGIVSLRSSGYGYQQSGKQVFKIVEYESTAEEQQPDYSKTIYCIKAGPGFGSTNMDTNANPTISTYRQKFDLKNLDSIESQYSEILPTGANYNKLMWVLDHLYIMPKPGTDNTTNRNAFLAEVIPNEIYEELTDDDIDVIQQLAIWYFTNPTGDYHYENIGLYINTTAGEDSNYKTFEDLFGDDGWNRQNAAKKLYSYYINSAEEDYTSTSIDPENDEPIELIKTNAVMQTIGNDYVAGPYKINKLLNVDYDINATYTDMEGNEINPTVAIKDGNGNIVTTDKTLKELVGTEFYLVMPTSSNITGIKMQILSSYILRTATYWSVENAPETEQPVVIVEEKSYDFSADASIIVPKPFDLSLRKFITEVNGVAVNSRVPEVDVTALKSGESSTATYNHPKTPIKVAIGDEVVYTIRVYNEGNVDGYVEEITDHLPAQLEFITNDELNIKYGWEYASSSDLKTIKTSYLSKDNEVTALENKILAYDGGADLDYKEVKIKCKVVATNPMPSKITNIADITDFTDGDGNEVTDRDSQENNVNLPTGTNLENYKDPEINRGEEYIPGQQDDDDFEKLMLKEFDLSLRKFITSVNDETITSRIPEVNTTLLANGTSKTATYNHPKTPVKITIGDIVTYTIRVYNEGDVDGYVEEITDHLPDQLEFLPEHNTNIEHSWVMYDADGNVTTDVEEVVTIKTTYLSADNEQTAGENKILAYDGGESLDYREVKVVCKVVATDPMPSKITNIADITDFTNGNGEEVTDRDSQENNVEIPQDLPSYKDNEIGKNYVPGQQDDDDFEKLILKEFDLSLRKFITSVNDETITSRIPEVDTTPLKNGTSKTAIYNHSKEPIEIMLGDIVTYTIRVYNEGDVDGYVEEITDHLPDQLEFLPEHNTNTEHSWVMYDADGNVTTDVEEAVTIKTTYLSADNEQTVGENKILAYDGGEGLDYREVKVVCKVVATDPMPSKITNIADITDFTNGNGEEVTDRDSQENNVEIPEDLPSYKDNEIGQNYVPGQQDDDDFEKIQIVEFDLALRKFIVAVNNTEITTREPQVDVEPLKNGENTAIYNHPKDPILVSNGNIVTYTIRVYNEGEMNGYAQEVKDDIPHGLEFLPEHNTNTEYRWVMLDEEGNETTEVSEAVSIVTDYLSKEQEETTGDNLLTAFDPETMETLDYKDVKVAFKVVEPNTSNRIVINQAQISEDSGEDREDVDDRDSTPDEWNEGEDDQDIEKVKVQYFDLSLRKWVTQAIVIENGEEIVQETGHKAEDDPEAIVKVDLKKSKLETVTVKFRYKIRVTNEGNIAGYVREIKDYVPQGLKYIQEDNPLWTALDDNTIVTDQAKDILLQPGDSTEVEVLLTWINDEDNMGVMVNWAEISKDYNEFESPDIDSDPDNYKEGEDDIDEAPVMVTVQTGEIRIYATIALVVLLILTTGVVLIKKFVL